MFQRQPDREESQPSEIYLGKFAISRRTLKNSSASMIFSRTHLENLLERPATTSSPKRSHKGFEARWLNSSILANNNPKVVAVRLRLLPVVRTTHLMGIAVATSHDILLIFTLVEGEFFERLTISKLPGEVIVHHSNDRWNTRSISLVGPRPTTGRVYP